MEEVQEAGITGVEQAQGAHEAGHARQVRAQAQRGQDEGQPEESGLAAAGRAQSLEGIPPGPPQD